MQTRGQQTGDQSLPGRGALQGITAEGDVVATTVSSVNTLKHAVSAPSAEHSAPILVGGDSGWDDPVSPSGAGSPTSASVTVPRGVNAQPLGIVSHAGDGARMTDSARVTEGCSGIEGDVCGLASTAHHAPYIAPPFRHPISRPIIYGDLNNGTVLTNLGSQSGVPKLFGLPAPVYAGTVPAGAPNTAPMAAARARSPPAARVDKSGTETALRDERLANYQGRLGQEGSVSPVPNAVAYASAPHSAEHSQMVHLRADSASNPLQLEETVSPWTRHQERAHRLSACPDQPSEASYHMRESVPCVSMQSVPRYPSL